MELRSLLAVGHHWLLDIAQELNISTSDGTLPHLGLDRVWITADGRAKLFDFPAPGIESGNSQGNAKEIALAKQTETSPAGQFLLQVANASLLGVVRAEANGCTEPPPVPLPMEARALLAKLPEAKLLDARRRNRGVGDLHFRQAPQDDRRQGAMGQLRSADAP